MPEPDFARLRAKAANLRLRDLVDLGVSLGWTDAGIGRHQKLRKKGRSPIAIPNHKKLKRGTVLNVLSRLEDDDLLDIEGADEEAE